MGDAAILTTPSAAFAIRDPEASKAAHDAKAAAAGAAGAEEIHGGTGSDFIKSIIFGGVDGAITTFSTIASVAGGNLPIGAVMFVLSRAGATPRALHLANATHDPEPQTASSASRTSLATASRWASATVRRPPRGRARRARRRARPHDDRAPPLPTRARPSDDAHPPPPPPPSNPRSPLLQG